MSVIARTMCMRVVLTAVKVQLIPRQLKWLVVVINFVCFVEKHVRK